jgi:signal transduction histidine kinase
MCAHEFELSVHRFLDRLHQRMRRARDLEQGLHAALRGTREFFGVPSAGYAELDSTRHSARMVFSLPAGEPWDLDLLARYLRKERIPQPSNLALAALFHRGRLWRVLTIRSDGEPFADEQRRALTRIARQLSEHIGYIERDRISEVRSRIDRKVIQQLRPQDLFYQILHGLRTLTGYDHSAALLIVEEEGATLRLVAEQIAWRKGKSSRIGLRLPLGPPLGDLLQIEGVYGIERSSVGWSDWSGRGGAALAERLDYNSEDVRSGVGPIELEVLCAPVLGREGLVGVIKVASSRQDALREHEARLLARFLPHVAVAIQNSRRAETLEAQILQSERKHVLADLARSVAHDVNNALGSVLPLVQQISQDLARGRLDSATLSGDLREIERSVAVCQRIFGGMLAFARGAARGGGAGDVGRAIDDALMILRDGMDRRGIRCEVDVAPQLGVIPARQSELEQIVLNLLSNARDAMPDGGTLSVRAKPHDGRVELCVEDSGVGIAAEALSRVFEPFYSTKAQGTGLGLTICRSIVWELRGTLEIDSQPGRGTRVCVGLPVATAIAGEG